MTRPHRKLSVSVRALRMRVALALCAILLLPGTAAAQDEGSAVTDLFASVAKGVAGDLGGAAAGWVLGALGLSNGSDDVANELSEMNDELSAIETTLTELATELSQLEGLVAQLDCDSLASDTLSARTLIDSLSEDYAVFVATASGSPAAIPAIECPAGETAPGDCLVSWANAVLDDGTTTGGVLNALNAIHQALISVGSSQGILSACLAPEVLAPPTKGTLDDRDYYDQVGNLLDVFYDYQTRGLLLLVEAYHFRAWQAAGEPGGAPGTDPNATVDLCSDASEGSVIQACNGAVIAVNTIYGHLVLQFEEAGVPYTSDASLLQYSADAGSSARANLFVRSLEAFTEAAGDDCETPLSSASACGSASTRSPQQASFATVEFDGYTNWVPAGAGALQELLSGQSSNQTAGEYMNHIGFENARDKLVLTPNTVNVRIGDGSNLIEPIQPPFMYCFMDTDIVGSRTAQPICSPPAFYTVIGPAGTVERSCFGIPTNTLHIWQSGSWMPSDRAGFYSARAVVVNGTSGSPCRMQFDTPPGYWVNDAGRAPQFVWPAIPVQGRTCTNGRVAKNPGGAFTRCGDDFDAYLEQVVPAPPTPSSATALGSAVAAGPGGVSGMLRLTATFPLEEEMDLARVSISLEDVLVESGVELVSTQTGVEGVPEQLHPRRGARWDRARYATRLGRTQLDVRLRQRGGALEASIHLRGARLSEPALCDGTDSTETYLTTHLQLIGENVPSALAVRESWTCERRGGRTLLTLDAR